MKEDELRTIHQFFSRFDGLRPGILTEEELIEAIHDCKAFIIAWILKHQDEEEELGEDS